MTSASATNQAVKQPTHKENQTTPKTKLQDEESLAQAELPLANMPGVYIADWRPTKPRNQHEAQTARQRADPKDTASFKQKSNRTTHQDADMQTKAEHQPPAQDSAETPLEEFESIADQVAHRAAKIKADQAVLDTIAQQAAAAAAQAGVTRTRADKNYIPTDQAERLSDARTHHTLAHNSLDRINSQSHTTSQHGTTTTNASLVSPTIDEALSACGFSSEMNRIHISTEAASAAAAAEQQSNQSASSRQPLAAPLPPSGVTSFSTPPLPEELTFEECTFRARELQTSIQLLVKSNAELNAIQASDTESPSDVQLYRECIQENELAMKSQAKELARMQRRIKQGSAPCLHAHPARGIPEPSTAHPAAAAAASPNASTACAQEVGLYL